jgi:hypothetical protein
MDRDGSGLPVLPSDTLLMGVSVASPVGRPKGRPSLHHEAHQEIDAHEEKQTRDQPSRSGVVASRSVGVGDVTRALDVPANQLENFERTPPIRRDERLSLRFELRRYGLKAIPQFAGDADIQEVAARQVIERVARCPARDSKRSGDAGRIMPSLALLDAQGQHPKVFQRREISLGEAGGSRRYRFHQVPGW